MSPSKFEKKYWVVVEAEKPLTPTLEDLMDLYEQLSQVKLQTPRQKKS